MSKQHLWFHSRCTWIANRGKSVNQQSRFGDPPLTLENGRNIGSRMSGSSARRLQSTFHCFCMRRSGDWICHGGRGSRIHPPASLFIYGIVTMLAQYPEVRFAQRPDNIWSAAFYRKGRVSVRSISAVGRYGYNGVGASEQGIRVHNWMSARKAAKKHVLDTTCILMILASHFP